MAAIEVTGVTKRYGTVEAVCDADFAAEKGRITGSSRCERAGKSTTLRVLLGLARPDAGSALIDGVPYRALHAPARTVGALIDIAGANPRMTARAHLRTYAALSRLPKTRVEQAPRRSRRSRVRRPTHRDVLDRDAPAPRAGDRPPRRARDPRAR